MKGSNKKENILLFGRVSSIKMEPIAWLHFYSFLFFLKNLMFHNSKCL